MIDESAFDSSLGALSQFFVGDRTMLETLQRVSEITVAAIPEAALVGVTMLAPSPIPASHTGSSARSRCRSPSTTRPTAR